MKPIDGFDAAMERVTHLLRLYDLLHNTRARRIRRDWASSFLDLMRWPKGEAIMRIDGKDKQSLLILRASLGLDPAQFAHDYLSELLRSAVVATVSGLDRYMHDLVLFHCWAILGRPESSIPTALRNLSLPVLATKRALEKLRSNPKARPGSLVKAALQTHLHRAYTFQGPDDLAMAAKLLGVEGFWGKVAAKMPGGPTKGAVIEQLKVVTVRRNQVVHEADILRKTKAKKVTLRDISRPTAESLCGWTRSLVGAIDQVVAAEV